MRLPNCLKLKHNQEYINADKNEKLFIIGKRNIKIQKEMVLAMAIHFHLNYN